MPLEPPTSQTTVPILDRIRGLLGGGNGAAFGPVTTDYGAPAAFSGAFHSGIDFAAVEGSVIHEPIGGWVKDTFSDSSGGNQVVVHTFSGYDEVYAHLSHVIAQKGLGIVPGDVIGSVGHTGMATGPHLHYEVVKPGGSIGSRAGTIDPRLFIGEFGATAGAIPNKVDDATIKVIQDRLNQLAFKVKESPITHPFTEADAAAALERDFPNIPVNILQAVAYGQADSVKQTIPDASKVPVLGGIGQSILSAGNPTGFDWKNPKSWASVALTGAGVGLIAVGAFLYIGGFKNL